MTARVVLAVGMLAVAAVGNMSRTVLLPLPHSFPELTFASYSRPGVHYSTTTHQQPPSWTPTT